MDFLYLHKKDEYILESSQNGLWFFDHNLVFDLYFVAFDVLEKLFLHQLYKLYVGSPAYICCNQVIWFLIYRASTDNYHNGNLQLLNHCRIEYHSMWDNNNLNYLILI